MTILNTQHSAKLDSLIQQNKQHLLVGGLKGIEKESLRISNQGMISQSPHPFALGSALSHPHITTDYSEALLEFITPASVDIIESLTFLQNIHQYVYGHLDEEMLLSTSMPCGINGDESIPIAEYGDSNIGKMKHVYRQGLCHRYGRTMQAIAGIHFNYSIPQSLWPVLHQLQNDSGSLKDFISKSYFGLIRNFQRQGWLILYLFGASPAICKSFFKSRPHLMDQFDEFDAYTLYHPYATSLRMSDIGYKSKNQASLNIDYNSLPSYIDSLSHAIETPYPEYQKIGVKVNGQYKQLNANILQIENEFYSTVRPKQIARSGEKPTLALHLRGVRYIEIRSLDLDPFNAIGLDENKARFIEAMLINCLMQDSPEQDLQQQHDNNYNQLKVAHQGRKPGLKLIKDSKPISLKQWSTEILDSMSTICEILDEKHTNKPYSHALNQQYAAIQNPDLTPSAKILQHMREENHPFGRFGINTSAQHKQHFIHQQLDNKMTEQFDQMALASHQKQKLIEGSDDITFDQFLKDYFAQSIRVGSPRKDLHHVNSQDIPS